MAVGKGSRTGRVGKRTRITGRVGMTKSRHGSKWGNASDSRSKVQYPTTTTT